jgi:hypothetical protein
MVRPRASIDAVMPRFTGNPSPGKAGGIQLGAPQRG